MYKLIIIIICLCGGCNTLYKGSEMLPIRASKSGLSDGYQEYTVSLDELMTNAVQTNNWIIVLYNKNPQE